MLQVFMQIIRVIGGLLFIALSGCSLMPEKTTPEDSSNQTQAIPISADTLVSHHLLQEELKLIKESIQQIHPEPFVRVDRAKFETDYVQVLQGINRPMKRAEFYRRVAPLIASLKDVHSYLSISRDQFGYVSHRQERLFPLAVVLLQEGVFVTADLSPNPLIPPGARLLKINQVATESLVQQMRNMTPKETETGQTRQVQLNFAWLLATLGYSQPVYSVEYEYEDQTYTRALSGLVQAKKTQPKTIQSYYGYTELTPSTSLIWLNDFNEEPEVFDRFLDKHFAQMHAQGTKSLIIDLRYNHGGLSHNLTNLLSRMTDKPIDWASHGSLKVSEYLRSMHRTATKQRRMSKYSWGLQWLPLEWTDQLQHAIHWSQQGSLINLDLEPVVPRYQQKSLNFWVLTNGFCYSACSFLVANVNRYGLAHTIGEQAGSDSRVQFAYPVEQTLPHTQLKLTLPTTRFVLEDDSEAFSSMKFNIPKQIIARSPQDIAKRSDPLIAAALLQAELQ
ncbi:S41 family peptidase [Aliikangiella sp. IMCC44653]